jgi:hypothetical protein
MKNKSTELYQTIVTDKSCQMMMTTLGVIGPDFIVRQKSNYYRMMAMSTLSACKMTDVFMIYSSHPLIWLS